MISSKRRFQVGRLFVTPAAIAALTVNGQTPREFIRRHVTGDWGVLCEEGKQQNEQALVDGSRLLSAYRLTNGEKLWIITEAIDDDGRRTVTTCLLPSDY